MKKWLYFTASTIMAIAAFISYSFMAACSTPFVPIANAALYNCPPFLKYCFLLFTFAAAALFLAFIILHDQEVNKKR